MKIDLALKAHYQPLFNARDKNALEKNTKMPNWSGQLLVDLKQTTLNPYAISPVSA